MTPRLVLLTLASLISLLHVCYGQRMDEVPVPVVNIGHQYAINQQVFGNVTNRLITVDDHNVIKTWDAETGGNFTTITIDKGYVSAVSFSALDNYVIVNTRENGADNTVFYSVISGEKIADALGGVASMSPDEKKIFHASLNFDEDESVNSWKSLRITTIDVTTRKSKIAGYNAPRGCGRFRGVEFRREYALILMDSALLIDNMSIKGERTCIRFNTDNEYVYGDGFPDRNILKQVQIQSADNTVFIMCFGMQIEPDTIIRPDEEHIFGVNFYPADGSDTRQFVLVQAHCAFSEIQSPAGRSVFIRSAERNTTESVCFYSFSHDSKNVRVDDYSESAYASLFLRHIICATYINEHSATSLAITIIEHSDTSHVTIADNFPAEVGYATNTSNTLLCISGNNRMFIYDISSGILLRELGIAPMRITGFQRSESGERLFLISDSLIRVYNFTLLKTEQEYVFLHPVQSIFSSFDGSRYYLFCSDSVYAMSVNHIPSGEITALPKDSADAVERKLWQQRAGCVTPVNGITPHGRTSTDRRLRADFVIEHSRIYQMTIANEEDEIWILNNPQFMYAGNDFIQYGGGIPVSNLCFSNDLRYVAVDNSETPTHTNEYQVSGALAPALVVTVYETYPVHREYKFKVKGAIDTMFFDTTGTYLVLIYESEWGYRPEVLRINRNGPVISKTELIFNNGNAGKSLVFVLTNPYTIEIQVLGNGEQRTDGWMYNTESTTYFLMPCSFYHVDKDFLAPMNMRYEGKFYPIEQFDVYYNNPAHIIFHHFYKADTSYARLYQFVYNERLRQAQMKYNGTFRKEKGVILGGFFPDTGPITIAESKSHSQSAVTGDSIFELRVAFRDSLYPLHSIGIEINGVPCNIIEQQNKADSLGYTTMLIRVQLLPGMNRIIVHSKNTKGEKGFAKPVFVQYNEPRNARKPELYFVGIGVSEYRDSTMNLNYASKDIRDIAVSFGKNTFYSQVHIDTLLNEKVTRQNILRLKDSLQKSNPNDVVVLYISGHGLLDDSLNFFYATHDANFSDPAKDCISFSELEGLLDSIPARKKIMFIDACHAGSLNRDMLEIAQSDTTIMKPKSSQTLAVQLTNPKGFEVDSAEQMQGTATDVYQVMNDLFINFSGNTGAIVMSGSAGNGYALESPLWNNGVFTYCLIQGMMYGEADIDGNNEVTVRELKAYIERQVTLLTNGRQQPNIRKETLNSDWRIY